MIVIGSASIVKNLQNDEGFAQLFLRSLTGLHKREHIKVAELGECLARVQELELEDAAKAGNGGAGLLNELSGGADGATGGDEVVHEQHLVTGLEGIGMDLDRIGAVFELIGLGNRLARELAGLACGNETGAERDGHGGAHEEPARLGTDDLGDALTLAGMTMQETVAITLAFPIQPVKYISAMLYGSMTTLESSDSTQPGDGPLVTLGKLGMSGFRGLPPPLQQRAEQCAAGKRSPVHRPPA